MLCKECSKSAILSQSLPYCPECIRSKFEKLRPEILNIHKQTRIDYNLVLEIPRDKNGLVCGLCVNNCIIGRNSTGYCGVRKNNGERIAGPDEKLAYVDWYHDPLPTNCVADWACKGSKDLGYKNLAVFYEACTFNCLFCQNWQFRTRKNKASIQELASAADPLTSCICYFGGDPAPFALHSIATAREILERNRNKKFRVCWETNGSVSPEIMKTWLELAIDSDGCIKIDFKAFSEELNIALCNGSNRNTKENIMLIAKHMSEREKPPILVVSTLLIPGYIDEYELTEMAKFLSSTDKNIPWAFLCFYPHFYFSDLPQTSRKQADTALKVAAGYGMKYTHLGNVHLLV